MSDPHHDDQFLDDLKGIPGDLAQMAELAYFEFNRLEKESAEFDQLEYTEKQRWLRVAQQLKAQAAFDHLVFQGETEKKFGAAGDKLYLLAEAIGGPGHRDSVERSHFWWSLYVMVISGQMKNLARELPGLMAHVMTDSADKEDQ